VNRNQLRNDENGVPGPGTYQPTLTLVKERSPKAKFGTARKDIPTRVSECMDKSYDLYKINKRRSQKNKEGY
jgi:Sperm-tail PG-rich repeat